MNRIVGNVRVTLREEPFHGTFDCMVMIASGPLFDGGGENIEDGEKKRERLPPWGGGLKELDV